MGRGGLIVYLVIVADVVERWWGQGAHLWFTTAVFSKDRNIYNTQHPEWQLSTRVIRQSVEIQWFRQFRDLPPLFYGCHEVRTREHGEQAVAVGRRRLVTGARRVTLIGWPAAVHGLPDNKRKGGVSAILRINFKMWSCMVKFIAWCLRKKKDKNNNSKFVKWINFSLKHFQSRLNNSFYCAVL